MTFVIWFSQLLQPLLKNSGDYIFLEGEEILSIFFFIKGDVQYVIPKCGNRGYIQMDHGDMFGVSDIFASICMEEKPIDEWYTHRHSLYRHSTIMAREDSEVLSFTICDFNLMSKEFPAYYDQLKNLAMLRMRMILKLKLKSMKHALQGSHARQSLGPGSQDLDFKMYRVEEVDQMIVEDISSDSSDSSSATDSIGQAGDRKLKKALKERESKGAVLVSPSREKDEAAKKEDDTGRE